MLGDDVFYRIAVGRLDVDRACPAVRPAASPRLVLNHPARAVGGLVCRTGQPEILRAGLDFPARDHGEERTNACDADLLVVDRLAQAANAVEIRFGVKAVPRGFPDGEDQSLALVQSERGNGKSEEVSRFADR